jgi:colanic acid/amylovoran biosynthesis protein
MIIEVAGTSTRNKGAELMLVAIREHFASRPNVQLAVDQFFGSYPERAQYGLLQKVALSGWGRSRLAVEIMPDAFKQAFGLVEEKDVDVLLDASGFAFGDQHPPERAVRFADRVEAAKQAGKTVILLPQALGPFRQPTIRGAFARIVTAADLIFARDDVSMRHAQEAAGTPDHLLQAPDFTNLVQPAQSGESEASDRVCIVPNERMVEKAETAEEAEAYVPLMVSCITAVKNAGLRPVLLLHGDDDAELAESIRQRAGGPIPLHTEDDPVVLKRYLGESHLVIASRFHALMGALSQGVPSIGTSWSHKYEMLFDEYGCPDQLLSTSADEEHIRTVVHQAVGPDRDALARRVQNRAKALKQQTTSMWKRVDAVLNHNASA